MKKKYAIYYSQFFNDSPAGQPIDIVVTDKTETLDIVRESKVEIILKEGPTYFTVEEITDEEIKERMNEIHRLEDLYRQGLIIG